MNNTLFFVVCIVTVVMAANVCMVYLKTRNRKEEHNPELEESLAQIERLEERIKVLERIVTESKTDLGREIDNLK